MTIPDELAIEMAKNRIRDRFQTGTLFLLVTPWNAPESQSPHVALISNPDPEKLDCYKTIQQIMFGDCQIISRLSDAVLVQLEFFVIEEKGTREEKGKTQAIRLVDHIWVWENGDVGVRLRA